MKVRAGFQSGTHAARQRAHLVRTAAALNLAPVALHTHLLSRKIQRREITERATEREREIDIHREGERERLRGKKKIVEEGAAICDFSGEINRGVTVVLKC